MPVGLDHELADELVGDYGLYAVFLLMLIDAVFPAASEIVMVYGGAIASGAIAGAVGDAVRLHVRAGLPGLPRDRARRHGRLPRSAPCSAGRSGVAAGGRISSGTAAGCTSTQAKLERAEAWFERWGDWAVLLGRVTRSSGRSSRSRPASSRRRSAATRADADRLGDLVLRVRRRRLGGRGELGELPRAFRYADIAVAVARRSASPPGSAWRLLRKRRAGTSPDADAPRSPVELQISLHLR